MNKLIWHTEKRLISDLIPTEGNPRQMTDKEAADLKQSLKKFNLVDIPAINLDNRIISGHQRVSILKTEGRESEEIDVRVPNRKLTEAEHREYLLRANKNLGEWNYDLLANFSEEELNKVGFESEELDKIFNLEASEDDFDAEAEYESIKDCKVKVGDLYQLGNHRLLAGDSTKKEDMERLMGGEKAQCIFTDPPFNVGYDYWGFRKTDNFRKRQKGKAWGKQLFSDKKRPEEYQEFIRKFAENCFNFSKDNSSFYCYFASKQEIFVRSGIEEAGWHISQTLIWLKPSLIISPGQDYHRIYEPCYFGWKKGEKHFVNKKYTGKFVEITLLDFGTFEEMIDVLYERRDVATSKYLHPTQKPVRLADRAIRKHSNIEDIILEPFAGSGSTLIACEQMKRKCYGIELDPKFCEVIINRWEKFTGKIAVKLA